VARIGQRRANRAAIVAAGSAPGSEERGGYVQLGQALLVLLGPCARQGLRQHHGLGRRGVDVDRAPAHRTRGAVGRGPAPQRAHGWRVISTGAFSQACAGSCGVRRAARGAYLSKHERQKVCPQPVVTGWHSSAQHTGQSNQSGAIVLDVAAAAAAAANDGDDDNEEEDDEEDDDVGSVEVLEAESAGCCCCSCSMSATH